MTRIVPWMVLSSEHRTTIKLRDGLEFFAWAPEQWAGAALGVELDPRAQAQPLPGWS
jgi:hypothetical protein